MQSAILVMLQTNTHWMSMKSDKNNISYDLRATFTTIDQWPPNKARCWSNHLEMQRTHLTDQHISIHPHWIHICTLHHMSNAPLAIKLWCPAMLLPHCSFADIYKLLMLEQRFIRKLTRQQSNHVASRRLCWGTVILLWLLVFHNFVFLNSC